jgi:hypothetical protein
VGTTQSFEYHASTLFATVRQGFIAQWQCRLSLGLLGADAHTVAAIWRQFDVLPTELKNIADAKSCHTGEE